MSYANTEDVKVSLGRALSDDEADQADGLLDRIEGRILQRIPTLESRLLDEAGFEDILIEIEADAVARVIRNPSGLLTEQDGDYMYTRDRKVASGELSLTDDEWSRLGITQGAFSIAPYIGRTPGVEVFPDPFPLGYRDPLWQDL